MLIELRCATHGGAREGGVPGNLNSESNEFIIGLLQAMSDRIWRDKG